MKHRIFALAMAAATVAAPVSAQGICSPRGALVDQLIAKYGESPQGSGLNGTTRMLEIWASSDTGTWTILLTDTNGTSCIVAAGKDWLTAPIELSKAGSPA